MNDQETEARPELGRWVIVALIIVAGIVMFFLFAQDTVPAIIPSTMGGG